MSLERKDIRAKLDHDTHHALTVLADVDRLDIGEWVEAVLVREIERRVHEATLIANRIPRSGKTGSGRE